jgi:alpha-L-fucosidase
MKYVVFTTKHHDGFCMFDTHQTDYKVTSPNTPFSTNSKRNVTKTIFDSFRKENFMIGAYFSKPDWHSEYYWWPYFPPKDRNVNYDPAKYPERWQKFKDYTYKQIQELMTGYGQIDILWLDGGWVRPRNSIDTTVNWQKAITYDQDIEMPHIAAMVRTNQPGILIVDRTVPGEYENYTTPEQRVPNAPLGHPWESCITMGNSWSYVPGDHYKSADEIIGLLVKVVSRGGNLLLNIGPGPDGDWDPIAYERLKQIGDWMKINGEGIFGSQPVAPYSEKDIYYTQKENGVIYAFVLAGKDKVVLPSSLSFSLKGAKAVKAVNLLGFRKKLKWLVNENGIKVLIPASLQANSGLTHAATFEIKY